jgi:hypothetical protein
MSTVNGPWMTRSALNAALQGAMPEHYFSAVPSRLLDSMVRFGLAETRVEKTAGGRRRRRYRLAGARPYRPEEMAQLADAYSAATRLSRGGERHDVVLMLPGHGFKVGDQLIINGNEPVWVTAVDAGGKVTVVPADGGRPTWDGR